MRKIIFCIAYFSFPSLLFAQNETNKKNCRITLNIGVENQLPVKSFKTFYNYGLGATVAAGFNIFKHFNFEVEPGYTNYFYNLKTLGVSGSTGYFTILGGPKLLLPYKFYITAKAGLGVKLLKEEKESAMALSAGVGIYILKFLDFQVKYQKVNTSTTAPQVIAFRVGYRFRR